MTVVTVEQREATALITINRPEKRNALNAEVRAALISNIQSAAADASIRCIVLTGSGEKAFVAGADIGEFAQRTPVDQFHVMRATHVNDVIDQCRKPVIAAINGYCLGGGLELAMACDFRIASSSATFGQPEILLGIIPGSGGTQRLPRLVGLGAALKMILTGGSIDAAEAFRLGLVEEVVEPGKLIEVALHTAGIIASKSPIAVAAAKEATRAAMSTPLAEGLRTERGLYLLTFASEDKSEGIGAFLEKRTPRFTGR
jgi:enoyl-CoA hydratase